jgi:hypothetical protein
MPQFVLGFVKEAADKEAAAMAEAEKKKAEAQQKAQVRKGVGVGAVEEAVPEHCHLPHTRTHTRTHTHLPEHTHTRAPEGRQKQGERQGKYEQEREEVADGAGQAAPQRTTHPGAVCGPRDRCGSDCQETAESITTNNQHHNHAVGGPHYNALNTDEASARLGL